MSDERFADAYEGMLPSCGCFSLADGDVAAEGQMYIAATMNMCDQVAGALMQMNLCPSAAPHMTALLVGRMIVMFCGSQSGVDSVEEMLPRIRAMYARVTELIPLHQARAEMVALQMMSNQEVHGTC